MSADVQTIVIGAGVVGLSVAYALGQRGHHVLILERHGRIGAETSGRSSEVIHAGLYYTPKTLKADLCVRGRRILYAFAQANGIAHSRLGKFLVATCEEELPALEAIAAKAAANGVDDLVRLSAAEVRAREPELCCTAAYYSPSSGVIDTAGFMLALEGHIRSQGNSVVLDVDVTGLARARTGDFLVTTCSQGIPSTLTARNLIIAAGHGAPALGHMLGGADGYRVPATYVAKGHYFALKGRAPFRHLVYPIPRGGSLGVHLTLDVAGQARFGPDIEWCPEGAALTYDFDDPNGERLDCFEREVRRYWPDLPDGALAPAYAGVRSKLSRKGEPEADFAIHGEADHRIPRLVALYGIESPGLTSSLAIGEHVAMLLD